MFTVVILNSIILYLASPSFNKMLENIISKLSWTPDAKDKAPAVIVVVFFEHFLLVLLILCKVCYPDVPGKLEQMNVARMEWERA